jgi:hypothetical protein
VTDPGLTMVYLVVMVAGIMGAQWLIDRGHWWAAWALAAFFCGSGLLDSALGSAFGMVLNLAAGFWCLWEALHHRRLIAVRPRRPDPGRPRDDDPPGSGR